VDVITSLSNPLVKQARALRQRKARADSGLFLVEGIHHVGEAVEAGWDIETILYALKETSRLKLKLQPVSAQVMESLADKDNPQGILGIVRQKGGKFNELKAIRRAVALLAPQDPGNLGTILRTLDAVGADALFLLDGGVEPYHPTAVRASMGTLFWISIVQSSFDDFVAWARNTRCQLIGASARGDVDYYTLIPKEPWIVILGSEQKGLFPEHT
jgi:TrmH family RNA methyltransferase